MSVRNELTRSNLLFLTKITFSVHFWFPCCSCSHNCVEVSDSVCVCVCVIDEDSMRCLREQVQMNGLQCVCVYLGDKWDSLNEVKSVSRQNQRATNPWHTHTHVSPGCVLYVVVHYTCTICFSRSVPCSSEFLSHSCEMSMKLWAALAHLPVSPESSSIITSAANTHTHTHTL